MENEDFEGPLVDHRGVANALALCGCSVEQKNALIGEGFTSQEEAKDWRQRQGR
jgi:hypothetical protein